MFGVLTELRRYAADVPPTAVGVACDRRPPFSVGERARCMLQVESMKGALSTTH